MFSESDYYYEKSSVNISQNTINIIIVVVLVVILFFIFNYCSKDYFTNINNPSDDIIDDLKNELTFVEEENIIENPNQNNFINYNNIVNVPSNHNVVTPPIIYDQTQIDIITKYFEGAKTNSQLIEHIKKKNLDKDKTHFTLSICCDEINHEKGDLPELCRKLLGEVFYMGGLGGIPFPGITGLGATLHHVPENGTLFILYAPHVGISLEGKIGDYNRFGLTYPGHACGAAIGAYNKLKNLDKYEMASLCNNNQYDPQFDYILKQLSKHMNTINSTADENQINVNIANTMYLIIEEWIEQFKIEFKKQDHIKKLILLGGIIINVSSNPQNKIEDYFLIKNEEVIES